MELDNESQDAYAALANVKFMLEWDWSGAEKDYRRASELHLLRLTGARRYVRFLALTGRAQEGLSFRKRMIELDPVFTEYRILLGWDLQYARQYEEGIRHLQRMLLEDPNLPRIARYLLSWNYALAGRYAEAIAECERIHNPQPCAYAYAASGRHAKALALAKQNKRDDPVFIAGAYAALGDRDKALQLLERGYQEHLPVMVYIWASGIFDPLRSDPRFQDLLRRMHFPASPPR